MEQHRNDGWQEGDFHDPLQLFSDCHRRIERFLERIGFIAEDAGRRPLGPEQRVTLDTALRYFVSAPALHSRDEEDTLFPRLLACSRSGDLRRAIDGLIADHGLIELEHLAIHATARRWLETGEISIHEADRLRRRISALCEVYRQHIAIEDERILPLAIDRLDANAFEEMGREMAARRGLDFDHLPQTNRCRERRLSR